MISQHRIPSLIKRIPRTLRYALLLQALVLVFLEVSPKTGLPPILDLVVAPGFLLVPLVPDHEPLPP